MPRPAKPYTAEQFAKEAEPVLERVLKWADQTHFQNIAQDLRALLILLNSIE